MVKIKDQIPEGLQEKLGKAVAEPKKPKRQKIRVCRIVASTDSEIEAKCKQLRQFEYEERRNKKTIPVLFMWGQRKRLTKEDALWYQKMGAEVKYLSETEVKSLNIK